MYPHSTQFQSQPLNQSFTQPSQPTTPQNHAPFQHPLSPQLSPQLSVPPLEQVLWNHESQPPHTLEPSVQALHPFSNLVSKSPDTFRRYPHNNPSAGGYESAPVPRSPSSPPQNLVQPLESLATPGIPHPMLSPISPSYGNAPSLADVWLSGLEKDLFNTTPNLRNRESEESFQYERNNSDVGVYLPPHHYHVKREGPSNRHPLNQLHGAQVQQRSAMEWLNNGIIPDESVSRLDQPVPSSQNSQYEKQKHVKILRQQNPYLQEPVVRAGEFSPLAPMDKPSSRALPIREGAITKPPRRKNVSERYRCEECPELFENRVNALRHLKSCHRKKNPYPCNFCSASYEGPGARTTHMKKAHSDVMPQLKVVKPIAKLVNGKTRYFCGVQGCSKDYISPNNAHRHFEMHHAMIRYPCECGHEATTKANLKAHKATCRLHQEE